MKNNRFDWNFVCVWVLLFEIMNSFIIEIEFCRLLLWDNSMVVGE